MKFRYALLGLALLPSPALLGQERPRVQAQEAGATATAQADSTTPAATEQKKNKKGRWVPIVRVTQAFLKTLDQQQRSKAVLEFDSEQRVGWHFIPKDSRKGVALMEMNDSQKAAALDVLTAVVSQVGFKKSRQIMALEGVLNKLEDGKGRNERNPEKYFFTVFGEPKYKQRWGLSIEGHHLSLNFVFNGNKFLDSTPQFFATNPAKLAEDYGEGFPKGMQVLKAEEQLGFKLVKSLNEEQFTAAVLPGETPAEIRSAGEAQPPSAAARGIAVADLEEEQIETLKKLMKVYTVKMKPIVARGRWEAIEEAGMDKVKFAWSGAKRAGRGHYYAVQGPTFLIEFINVQADAAGNPANHVHCVWRDMQGDFDLPIK